MAGDWIKVEKATARKPEIFGIASKLGIGLDAAFGACVRFWFWCDDQMTDGNARCVTSSLLDDAIGVTGFADALISVGWLEVRSGSLQVPHFDRHLSESAKNRALSRKRTAKARTQQRDKCNGDGVTDALPEKRREETNTFPSHTRGGTWLEGMSEDFKRWWEHLPEGMRSGQQACWDFWPEVLINIQAKICCNEAQAITHLIQRTQLFANSPRGKQAKFRWKPLTFLKEGHYDDSIESWEVTSESNGRKGKSGSANGGQDRIDRNLDVLQQFADGDQE